MPYREPPPPRAPRPISSREVALLCALTFVMGWAMLLVVMLAGWCTVRL